MVAIDTRHLRELRYNTIPTASSHVTGNDLIFIAPPDPNDLIAQYFIITPTGVTLAPGNIPPQSAFDLLLSSLAADIDALKWRLAAACNLYRAQFGGNVYERAAVMAGLKWSINTIERWAWIERNVTPQARVPARIDGELTGMSIYWHEFVIGLPGQLQCELLSHCLQEKMPIHEFEMYCDKQRETIAAPEPALRRKRLTRDYVFELTETLAVTEGKLNEAIEQKAVETSQLSKTLAGITDRATRYEAGLRAVLGVLTGRG